MDLTVRSTAPEVMDAPDLDTAIYQRCLADLASVNRVTFTHRTTLRWLARATRGLVQFSVLDVAYGQGDLLRAIARWAKSRARLSGIDLNPRSAAAARAATPAALEIDYLTGDVFAVTPPEKPDFIVTSQFTHHLGSAEIIRLLRWMDATALRGWHIADLHRHPLAYFGFPLLARLMRWHQIVRSDGAISIARSFTRRDWEALLAEAGISAEIHWRLPFRYCVSRIK
jgi:2-polyprenyl-3-methyl-5-hydroxy-6-metoxy-1,4-benzoquinol methylase